MNILIIYATYEQGLTDTMGILRQEYLGAPSIYSKNILGNYY